MRKLRVRKRLDPKRKNFVYDPKRKFYVKGVDRPVPHDLDVDPLNPQPRPWRSGNCHCLMPVKGRLKSRVGSNPREALFRKFRKIIKFHRKIIKNH